jgi:two-component system alkaline phosphatase synthesis response regulator PhoP
MSEMPKTILVVDDEDNLREVTKMSLEVMGGYQTLAAASGPEAIEIAEREHPDAILLDVMMPGLDGPSTFRALQQNERTRDIPVVLLTAKVQAADRARFNDLGVVGVVAKPFDPAVLHETLAALLGWSDAQ